MLIFRYMFPLFTLIALAEVIAFIVIGDYIGLLWTVALVVLTAAIGVTLLKREGAEVIRRMRTASMEGRVPGVELIEGVLLVVAGALLLTPGFLTDIFGFGCLFRPSRSMWARALMGRATKMMFKQGESFGQTFSAKGGPFNANMYTSMSGSSQQSERSQTEESPADTAHRSSSSASSSEKRFTQSDSPFRASSNVIEGEFQVKDSAGKASNDPVDS